MTNPNRQKLAVLMDYCILGFSLAIALGLIAAWFPALQLPVTIALAIAMLLLALVHQYDPLLARSVAFSLLLSLAAIAVSILT